MFQAWSDDETAPWSFDAMAICREATSSERVSKSSGRSIPPSRAPDRKPLCASAWSPEDARAAMEMASERRILSSKGDREERMERDW